MRKESVKNHGKSIRSKLLNVAQNEGIYYQTILTRYFQERLIYRISQTPYRQNFYLKGGALMYAHEKFAARPTLDPAIPADCEIERKTMDLIYKHLKADRHPVHHWYYGHFHQSWNSEINGILFSMLDIMEFKELRSSNPAS